MTGSCYFNLSKPWPDEILSGVLTQALSLAAHGLPEFRIPEEYYILCAASIARAERSHSSVSMVIWWQRGLPFIFSDT